MSKVWKSGIEVRSFWCISSDVPVLSYNLFDSHCKDGFSPGSEGVSGMNES